MAWLWAYWFVWIEIYLLTEVVKSFDESKWKQWINRTYEVRKNKTENPNKKTEKNNAENKKTKKVNEEKIENWCVTKWNEEDRANEDKVKWKQWFKTNGWCMNRTQMKSSDKMMKWKK